MFSGSNLYLFISLATWPVFAVSNMVLTFQFPILVLFLGFTIEAVGFWSSFRLWPKSVILLLRALVASPMLIEMSSVSVISLLLREWVISPQLNPQPGGPGGHTSSGLYPSTCSAWHGWPYQEYKTPADIALGVIETRKPSHRDKVVTPSGYPLLNFAPEKGRSE